MTTLFGIDFGVFDDRLINFDYVDDGWCCFSIRLSWI